MDFNSVPNKESDAGPDWTESETAADEYSREWNEENRADAMQEDF